MLQSSYWLGLAYNGTELLWENEDGGGWLQHTASGIVESCTDVARRTPQDGSQCSSCMLTCLCASCR